MRADSQSARWCNFALLGGIAAAILALALSRFFHIDADPPTAGVAWEIGGFVGDEGLWYRNALWEATRDQWYRDGGYNPAVVVPVMPVLAIAMEVVTGDITRTSVRVLTAVIVLLGIAMLSWGVYRRCGLWPGFLTGLLLASSLTLFVHSRMALVDAPSSAFLAMGLALLLGWQEVRPTWATVLAAVMGVLAVLTKSTMVMAIPAYLLAAWVVPGCGGRRWRDPLLLVLIGGVMLGAYGAGVLWFFHEDFTRFREANATPRDVSVTTAIYRCLMSGYKMGRWLFALFVVCLVAGLWRLRGKPGYPWVVSGLVWMAFIAAAIIWKGSMPPRYFVPLIWPAAAIVGVVAGYFMAAHQGRLVWALVLMAVLMVSAYDAVGIARHLHKPRFTYRDMGADLRQRVDALGGPEQWALIGGWPADGVGFAAGVPAVGNREGIGDIDDALDRYPVCFFVSWDEDQHNTPDMLAAIESRYEFGETIHFVLVPTAEFYVDRPIRVTRLIPRSP